RHQRVSDLAGGQVGGQVDVLPQPGKRGAHQITVPNGRAYRTSPSNMSRMSCESCRNISVRSIPMPNANPEYLSVSTPQARSTCGLTMPQPPHSIQPSEEQVRHGLSGSSTDAPRQTKHFRSNSADGSVNGKNDGRHLISCSGPNIAR